MGERLAVCGVTGPGMNVRESSRVPGCDAKALSSSYSNDSTGTRRSGQGEVPSKSLSSNSAVSASGVCCKPFSTRFLSSENQWRHETYQKDTFWPRLGCRCSVPRKLGRIGSHVQPRCLDHLRKGGGDHLLGPNNQGRNQRLLLNVGAIT